MRFGTPIGGEKMLLAFLTLVVSILTLFEYPKWAMVVLSASIVYGALSTLVSARRLYFLSAASAHVSLLAVVLAIPLSRLALNEYIWAVLIGLIMIHAVGYSIRRGMDEDVATAIFVSFAASLSVIAMYIVLTTYSMSYDLWAIIIGDPLLATWGDVAWVSAVAVLTLIATILTYREQITIGVERDCAVLTGIRVEYYDFLLYTLLAVSTVAMIRVVGFVLQHVLIFLPSAIASLVAKDSKSMLSISVLVSVLSGMLGLQISVVVNQAPSGVIGLLMFGVFAFTLLAKRCCHE